MGSYQKTAVFPRLFSILAHRVKNSTMSFCAAAFLFSSRIPAFSRKSAHLDHFIQLSSGASSPVSYTHLDVYKRQQHSGQHFQGIRKAGYRFFVPVHGFGQKSSLDVYKRQVYYWAKGLSTPSQEIIDRAEEILLGLPTKQPSRKSILENFLQWVAQKRCV